MRLLLHCLTNHFQYPTTKAYPRMDRSTPEKKTLVEKLMSPWTLTIVSILLIGGAGTLSALVAVGILP